VHFRSMINIHEERLSLIVEPNKLMIMDIEVTSCGVLYALEV